MKYGDIVVGVKYTPEVVKFYGNDWQVEVNITDVLMALRAYDIKSYIIANMATNKICMFSLLFVCSEVVFNKNEKEEVVSMEIIHMDDDMLEQLWDAISQKL